MRRNRLAHENRTISIGGDIKSNFINNRIQTSKYTKLNFLPKSILLEFFRARTIYFLISIVIVLIPEISPLAPFSVIIPFIFLITFSVILEGVKDFPSQRSDSRINSKITCRLAKTGQFSEIRWDNIKVGDLIFLREHDEVPADLVLLSTSNQDNTAYVDTRKLGDGEDLRSKLVVPEIIKYFDSEVVKDEALYNCKIQAEPSNPYIYTFNGAITTENGHQIPLGERNLLMGRSKLKNTSWALGVVVYTGCEMKIMMNSVQRRKNKVSQIEKLVNKIMMIIVAFQVALCVLLGGLSYAWCDNKNSDVIYKGDRDCNSSLLNILSYFVLSSAMIPIFLFVSLEIVRFLHAFFIEKDEDMFNTVNVKHARAFNSSIVDNLGLVKYIFLDKTGVLTSSNMTFRSFIIGNKTYEETSPAALLTEQLQADIIGGDLELFGSENLPFKSQRDLIFEFMEAVCICHDCIAEKAENLDKFVYRGRSQEEKALLDRARDIGFVYLGGAFRKQKIQLMGDEKEVEILQVLDFSYTRRRMSILVRDRGILKLYIKGSYDAIFERLSRNLEQPFSQNIPKKLCDYVEDGCRSLVYAMRILKDEEYQDILENVGTNIPLNDDTLANELEKDLILLGCSILENKLGKNVPEVIDDLSQAGMKFVVLTGDRLGTAEVVSERCHLIKEDTNVLGCRSAGTDPTEVKNQLVENQKELESSLKENRKSSFSIDGVTLCTVLRDRSLQELLLSIILKCDTVICGHVTPKQKAEVVQLIKVHTGKITLAVGDGSNDVNMLQAADIAIGFYGREGKQTIHASDFAIAEVQSLWRLLLVHGRWSYLRISEMVLYFLYKNMLFTLPQIFFAIHCGLSGQTIYEDYYITFYNLIFTALALVLKAILDQDANYKRIKIQSEGALIEEDQDIKDQFPKLYDNNRNSPLFTLKNSAKWIAEGIVVSVILYFCAIEMIGDLVINNQGQTGGMWYFSITLYSAVILIVDVRLALSTRSWTLLYTLVFIFSVLFYFAYTGFYNSFSVSSYTVGLNYGSVQFYAFMLLMAGTTFVVDVAIKTWRNTSQMSLADTLKCQQKQKRELKYKAIFQN